MHHIRTLIIVFLALIFAFVFSRAARAAETAHFDTLSHSEEKLYEEEESAAQWKFEAVENKELLEPCGMEVDEIEVGLHEGLKDYVDDFLQAEYDTGVNAVFLAAVAALESGWGESELAETNNNLFGWTDSDGYMEFESAEECISYVAEYLREEYLTPGGENFNGYTVEDVCEAYNGNDEWSDMVRQIMFEIQERGKEWNG